MRIFVRLYVLCVLVFFAKPKECSFMPVFKLESKQKNQIYVIEIVDMRENGQFTELRMLLFRFMQIKFKGWRCKSNRSCEHFI